MSTAAAFRELDTEAKACAWFWQERFGGAVIVCPHCEEIGSYWQHRNAEIRECSVCCTQVRRRASGLLRDSKLPLLKWVRALIFVMTDKRGTSALALQRQLELESYRTAWALGQKIRMAFAARDAGYQLSESVELDGAAKRRLRTRHAKTVTKAPKSCSALGVVANRMPCRTMQKGRSTARISKWRLPMQSTRFKF